MKDNIAIIGYGSLFPDSFNNEEFYRNIKSKKVSIKQLPENKIKRSIYYRPDLYHSFNKHEKSVTDLGALISDFSPDPTKYRLSPKVGKHVDINQFAALYTTEMALSMCNIEKVSKEKTGVVFSAGFSMEQDALARKRIEFEEIPAQLENNTLFCERFSKEEQKTIINDLRRGLISETVPITEDTAPGILPNIVAGRIASVFDLHGSTYTVDAACASGLAALLCSIRGLQCREYDMVISGATDMHIGLVGLVYFSGIGALSPDGSFPFDKRANGFVMGQGCGSVILKRLDDAIKDEDNIYGVITGYGHTSDGKGKSIAAPNYIWQAKAIENAYKSAGYSINTVEYIEAHGTATAVGDVSEVKGLKQCFKSFGCESGNFCGLSSVKSNIGHLKTAAGIAGFNKAILSLNHKQLLPVANFETINPALKLDQSPFYIISDTKEWEAKKEHPRRCGVSSFGFGGANYHVALEEYKPDEHFSRKFYQTEIEFQENKSNIISINEKNTKDIKDKLALFSENSIEDLLEKIRKFIATGRNHQDSFVQNTIINNQQTIIKNFRIAFSISSFDDLVNSFLQFESMIQNRNIADIPSDKKIRHKGIFFNYGPSIKPQEIAILFPGQGSQYPMMLNDIYESIEFFRYNFSQIDSMWKELYGHSIRSLIFNQREDSFETMKQTENTHPIIFIANISLFLLLKKMGLNAQYMVGHSLGEICALAASEMVSLKDAITLTAERGKAFKTIQGKDTGKMVSVNANCEYVRSLIYDHYGKIWIANINSPNQTVVSGHSKAIDDFIVSLQEKKIQHKVLPVSHAFHSPIMKTVAENFYNKIDNIRFSPPKTKVISNLNSSFYSTQPESLKQLPQKLKQQIYSPVNFVNSIRRLFSCGARLFIEVGPGSVLTNLTKDILLRKDIKTMALNYKNKNDIESLYKVVAELFSEGICLDYSGQPELIPTDLVDKTNERKNDSRQTQYDKHKFKTAYQEPLRKKIVYSGVSLGLPGSYKNVFSDDNFDQVCSGRNFIERLTDDEKQLILDQNITRLVKKGRNASFKKINVLNEVIQLAGKLGQVNLVEDYLIDEKLQKNLSSSIGLAVAAGYEALKDAHIPLVREYIKTPSGSLIPHKWSLPEEMQDETGIIYASGFPMIEPFIAEVSKYMTYRFGSKLRKDIIEFYEKLISQISDPHTKKLITDWFTLNYSRISNGYDVNKVYEFNHQLLNQISGQANNILAELINARGPNFHINAACSSTATAITIAEDMIRTGRVKRMIIIAADTPTSPTLMPWIGASFLSSGAATDKADLYQAAIPFDRNRNGMILGSGALSIIIENETELNHRGVNGVCELIGTHTFNTAFQMSKLNIPRYTHELDNFLNKLEKQSLFNREENVSSLIYVSHEPYTPPAGGSSESEARALKNSFGNRVSEIVVTNTKGMTGHCMAGSIETAVAAKALQHQKVPPVVNLLEKDPDLKYLNLSTGGHQKCSYALGMAAGFGSQGNYYMLKKIDHCEKRIKDEETYFKWLQTISDQKNPDLGTNGRVLVINEKNDNDKESLTTHHLSNSFAEKSNSNIQNFEEKTPEQSKNHGLNIESEIIKIISDVTSYPAEMLDLEAEFEADLAIDTIKIGQIMALINEKFNLDHQDKDIQLSNYPTIKQLIEMVKSILDYSNQETIQNESKTEEHQVKIKNKTVPDVKNQVFELIEFLTEYPRDLLGTDMELESDLNISSNTTAQLFAELSKKYDFEIDNTDNFSENTTIADVIAFVEKKIVQSEPVVTDNGIKSVENKNIASERNQKINSSESELTRQTVTLCEFSSPGIKNTIKLKNILLIGENDFLIDQFSHHLMSEGANVTAYHFANHSNDVSKMCETIRDMEHIDIVIDVTHAGESFQFLKLSYEEAKKLLVTNIEVRFLFFKKIQELVHNLPEYIICLTSIDGYLGYSQNKTDVSDPSYGAIIGFYKGLRKEWKESVIKAIDFQANKFSTSFNEVLDHLRCEIHNEAIGVEVAFPENKRMITKIAEKPIVSKNDLKITDDDTILITGGGTGITSEILPEIAKNTQANMIIIGRTKLPENIKSLAEASDMMLEEMKDKLKKKLVAENQRLTPVKLETEWEKITKAITIFKNLCLLKSLGSNVSYYSCDITDYQRTQNVLNMAIQKYGKITGIVHGAGVEKSALLNRKSLDDFRDVYNVKALGALNITWLTRNEPIRFVAAFSSIAGRFGNEAQIDYSAANNFLNYLIKMYHSNHKNIHAVSINWSGWKNIGMAWRNSLVRNFSEQLGLNLIDPKSGAKTFFQEMINITNDKEVLLHRGLSHFAEKSFCMNTYHNTPMIDRIVKQTDNTIQSYRVFSPSKDAFLDQHRLGKTPIIPGVIFLESFAEYYSLFFGNKGRYRFKNVIFENPMKLFHDKSREMIVQSINQPTAQELTISASSLFRSKISDKSHFITHSRATVSDDIPDNFDINELKWDWMNDHYHEVLLANCPDIQHTIHLGPLFVPMPKDIDSGKEKEIMSRCYPKGIVFERSIPLEQFNNEQYPLERLYLNPCFLDSINMAAATYCLYNESRTYLPWKIEELLIFKAPKKAGTYTVFGELLNRTEDTVCFNVLVTDKNNTPFYYAKKLISKRIQA